jgi:hypothetical protein
MHRFLVNVRLAKNKIKPIAYWSYGKTWVTINRLHEKKKHLRIVNVIVNVFFRECYPIRVTNNMGHDNITLKAYL